MILTITPNSAYDDIIFIDEFIPKKVMRTHANVPGIGGKGFDVSVGLQILGVDNLAAGIVAGKTGQRLVELLETRNIQCDLLWVEGETRTAHVIIEKKYKRHSHITVGGYAVTAKQNDAFLSLCSKHIPGADWVVCAGSLPPGMSVDFYQQIIELAQRNNIPSLIDCTGEPMLSAIRARPTIIKLNRTELFETFGVKADTMRDLGNPIKSLRQKYELESVVITGGDEGLFAATPDGLIFASAPKIDAVNAAGAGDTATAALVWQLAQRKSWIEAIRWATATSVATVLTEATAEFHVEEAEKILERVEIT